jgi:hypothetical protein
MRAFAVDYSTLRCSRAGRCKVILWAPLSTTFSFQACTMNANALKETPTAQLFDNRSIAELPRAILACIWRSFVALPSCPRILL